MNYQVFDSLHRASHGVINDFRSDCEYNEIQCIAATPFVGFEEACSNNNNLIYHPLARFEISPAARWMIYTQSWFVPGVHHK